MNEDLMMITFFSVVRFAIWFAFFGVLSWYTFCRLVFGIGNILGL